MKQIPLYGYQAKSVKKMMEKELTSDCYGIRGGILADEMGLGKTIQMLSLTQRNQKRTLVVCPVSIMHQWRDECIKFTDIQPLLVNVINVRKTSSGHPNPLYISPEELEGAQLVIASHSCFNNPSALRSLDEHSLLNAEFERVIYDEAHSLKNAKSKCATYAPQILAPIRWCLTGTPITRKDRKNNKTALSLDIVGLITFLLGNPSMRSRAKKMARNEKYWRNLIFRRTKESVGREVESLRLPEFKIHLKMVPFSDTRRGTYGSLYRSGRLLTNRVRDGGFTGGFTHVLSVITKLRQQCSAPPEKLDALRDCFDQHLPGTRSLIFCNYLEEMESVVEGVRDKVDRVLTYQGGMNQTQRDDVVKTFMDTESPRFASESMCIVIQFTSGSIGLNLQAAQHVYIMSPHWSAAIELQAISRAHRTNTRHPVTITRFVMEHTVEEYIHLHQKAKLDVAAYYLNEPKLSNALDSYDGNSVTWEDAKELFGSDLFD